MYQVNNNKRQRKECNSRVKGVKEARESIKMLDRIKSKRIMIFTV